MIPQRYSAERAKPSATVRNEQSQRYSATALQHGTLAKKQAKIDAKAAKTKFRAVEPS